VTTTTEHRDAASRPQGWHNWAEAVRAEFVAHTPRSEAAYAAAHGALPGGTPGGLGYMTPYPLCIDSGEGCYVWDADGTRLVDTFYGDWLMVLGHCNPGVTAAIEAQLHRGTAFGQPSSGLGLAMAEQIMSRVPSVERMRFTTSGSEATQSAIRLARAFTGRGKIAKMIGGYHGTHDVSLVANGRFKDPTAVPPGLIPGSADSVVLLPFNHVEPTEQRIEADAADLAAVIVEPILGGTGMIPATPEYLDSLRRITDKRGILLIMDEVVTFPVGPHGAQGRYGITPDLSTFGKSISGGLPMGAFGGRREIVDHIDPGIEPEADYRHGSTLGGTQVCLAAGTAQLAQMTPEFYQRTAALGDRLRAGVRTIAETLGVPIQSTGVGHLFAIHWGAEPVVDFDTVLRTDRQIITALALSMTNKGFFLRSSGNGIASAALGEEQIDGILGALSESIVESGLAG
jgi:glutamate-1-semialdehyde 2,1-aminomutase